MVDASFVVIGEALVDMISDAGGWRFEAAPGGSPLNVAVGLAAAGHRVRLAAELGDDMFGGLVRDHLARHRVDLSDLVTTSSPTSLAFARLDESASAGYDFRLGWSWRGRPDLTGVDCLHVGSLAAVLAPGAAAVRAAVADARRRGIPVSYDPNVRPALMGDPARAAVEALVTEAGIVKASSDDLAWLYPGRPPLDAAAAWARQGPGLVVVTRGAAGAVAFTTGYEVACPAPRVEVVDTVGAGDAFMAGLLSSLGRAGGLADPTRDTVDAALRRATTLAAEVCAARGFRLPEQIR